MSGKEYHSGRKRPAPRARQGTRTALYLRVSTAEQKPDLQYDSLRGYAERAGLDVVQDYCDVAVSGRREGRPRLNALTTAARNQEIDCVLVWKFDRFARSTRHLLTALEEVATAAGLDMRQNWTATKEYLARVPKALILQAVRDGAGGSAAARIGRHQEGGHGRGRCGAAVRHGVAAGGAARSGGDISRGR